MTHVKFCVSFPFQLQNWAADGASMEPNFRAKITSVGPMPARLKKTACNVLKTNKKS